MGSAPSTATPAAPADSNYARIEREVLVELNAVRTNPAGYAKHLSEMLPMFDGMLLRRPGRIAVRTQEGAAAVREAIDALRRQTPLAPLAGSSAIANAARDLANDQRRTGNIGHTASDGSTPGTRLDRYGSWMGSYGENVDYGSFASGRDVVIDLLVDDGVRDRGHRRNIFDASARVAGVACGAHPRYGSVCVIDQAAGFTPP